MNLALALLLGLGGAFGQVDLAGTAAKDAASAAFLVGSPEERVELTFRAAEDLAPCDPLAAAILFVDTTEVNVPPTTPIRSAANGALAALGAPPMAPTRSEDGWMAEARRRALERLFISDPAGALDSRVALEIGETELIELLLVAANAPEPEGSDDGEINYLDRPTLARLAVTEIEKMRSPDPVLLESAVRAVFALDPETAHSYLVQAGPTRPIAAELTVLMAATPEEAHQAAQSILDPARKADVLLRRAATEPTPEGAAALAQEAGDIAGLMADPAAKALVLARAAALLAPAPGSDTLAEQARQAAFLTTTSSARALALAQVAGCLGDACRDKADECLGDAIALAETEAKGGPRARAMMELGIACAPGLPDEAFRIADGLGGDRLASRAEVLLAVAESADDAGRAEAARRLLEASGSAGTAADQLRILRRLSLDALPPVEPVVAEPVTTEEAAAPAEAGEAPEEGAPAAPWPSPPPPRGLRGGAPIPEGGSAPPQPEEPEEEPAPEPETPPVAVDTGASELAAAHLEVWRVTGELLLKRAADRPNRTEKALAYMEAAEWLDERDPAGAAQALTLSAAELDSAPDSLGRMDILMARASALGPDVAADIARSLKDPGRRAHALLACGLVDEALGALEEVKDPWERASLAVGLVVADTTPTGVTTVLRCIEALPPSERRDDLIARAADGLGASPRLEAADGVTGLAGLASTAPALARARLAAARRAVVAGDIEGANEKVAQARELIATAGRPHECLARLAVVEQLLGEDGLATARGLTDHALRARTLLEIADLLLAPSEEPGDQVEPVPGPV